MSCCSLKKFTFREELLDIYYSYKTSAFQKLRLQPNFYFQASQFCVDSDKIFCLQISANLAIKKVTFVTLVFSIPSMKDSPNDMLTCSANYLTEASLLKRWSISERRGQTFLAKGNLPKPSTALQGWQCNSALWPADGGWSSGKNFAWQSRHNHCRPWEIPASLTHRATESTR